MARQGYPSDKQDQFVVRFPDGMRDRIKAAAEANGRSMNAEIIHALNFYYPDDPAKDPVLTELVDYVSDGAGPVEMKKRANEANQRLVGTRFYRRFFVGVIEVPSNPDGSLETCAALFEVDKIDGPDGPKMDATLKWWVSKH